MSVKMTPHLVVTAQTLAGDISVHVLKETAQVAIIQSFVLYMVDLPLFQSVYIGCALMGASQCHYLRKLLFLTAIGIYM